MSPTVPYLAYQLQIIKLKMMKITNKGRQYTFDRHIKSGKGFLFAIKITIREKIELSD